MKEMHFNMLMRLRHAVKMKQPGKLSKMILFLHDSTPAHKAVLIQKLLADSWWDIFSHAMYSPNLALSNYYLNLKLHKEINGHHLCRIEIWYGQSTEWSLWYCVRKPYLLCHSPRICGGAFCNIRCNRLPLLWDLHRQSSQVLQVNEHMFVFKYFY